MIRECITTHDDVRPLEPEHDLPVLHIDSSHLGLISPRWVQIYLAGIQRHEKKYAGTMRQIARRRERAITLLCSQDLATERGREEGTKEKDGAERGHSRTRKNVHRRAALSQGAIRLRRSCLRGLQLPRNASGMYGSRRLCRFRSPSGARRRGAHQDGEE